MERMQKTIVAMSMLAIGSMGGVASAQDVPGAETDSGAAAGGMPINYTQRPLTLRQRTLRVDVAPADFGLMDSGTLLGDVGPYGSYGLRFGQNRTHVNNAAPAPDFTATDGYASMGIGVAYGVLDRLEVGALLLPLNFDDGDAFGNLAFYARGTLIDDGGFALGIQGTLSLPTLDNLGIGIGHALRGRPLHKRRLMLCGLIIGSFLAGAVLGAVLFARLRYAALAVPAFATGAIGLGYAGYRQLRRDRSPQAD